MMKDVKTSRSRSRSRIRIIKKRNRIIKKKNRKKGVRTLPDELIQCIQSLLPVEEAARTCVLSKSWRDAWSTIPTLRFRPPGHQSVKLLSKDQKSKYIKFIKHTLLRYFRDNIPITSIDLHLGISNQKSASFVDKWIRPVASKSCLKELYLTIFASSCSFTYMLPDEIFSGENLNTLSVIVDGSWNKHCITINSNVVSCVKLRVLELIHVNISEEKVLDNLLSTCSLLEKIKLSLPKCFNTIKVRSLHNLCELEIISTKGRGRGRDNLEIYDVPSLCLFSYHTSFLYKRKPLSLNTGFLKSVRELFLAGVRMDHGLADVINSNFHFLESLTLKMHQCKLKTLDITCVSLKRLIIGLWEKKEIDLQVYALNLNFFSFDGSMIPNLLFPTVAPPEQIELRLMLTYPFDHSFFLRIREALNLSSTKFKITIVNHPCDSVVVVPHIDDLRTKVPIPAMNVEQICFMFSDEGLWEHSTFFDAFLSVCRPMYVEAFQYKLYSYSWEQIIRWMMEKKNSWPHLKDVYIKNHLNRKWETLKTPWTTPRTGARFKLTWC